eukprot:CCRYP_002057-RA/>CCRYP_002057-RA protein AED:0.39 eAED:0.39 QI:0/0/0/1/0/0/2/0/299
MDDHDQAPNNDKTNMVFMTIVEIVGQLFTNQMGRLSVTPNCSNNYIADEEVNAFLRVHSYCPQLHKLDNKTSYNVELFIKENNAKLQYTPTDIHRTNPAERAIRTWKNHFVANRAGTPPMYRLSNWCKDLEQTDITLNMLRPCTTNPKLSTYKAMEGMYLFDATLRHHQHRMCMIHIKPTRRQTWGYHAIKAWHCAPALNHYCGIKTVTDTGAVHLMDTFKFLHHTLPTLVISNTNRIVKATQQLQRAITGTRDAKGDEQTAIQHLQALISMQPIQQQQMSPPRTPKTDPNHQPSNQHM